MKLASAAIEVTEPGPGAPVTVTSRCGPDRASSRRNRFGDLVRNHASTAQMR